MKRALAALLIALLAGQSACATAKITRSDAVDLEAKIVGADPDHVYVVDDQERTFAVPRKTIRDIDHPGNVWMAASAPLVAAGGGFVVVAMSADCRDDMCGIFKALVLVGALIYGGLGVAGVTVGYSQWTRSVSRAEPDAGPPDWLRGRSVHAAPPDPVVGTVPPVAEPVWMAPAATETRP